MGVYEQLATDADRVAAQQLAQYLIETEGNRFYGQDIASVRNHIAGNDQLMVEAHKFQKELAKMLLHDPEKLVSALEAKAQKVVPLMTTAPPNPVKEMMDRFMNPAARKAFSEKIENLLKQRATKH
jgi:hypothetical protein